jgi:hypothetical protein
LEADSVVLAIGHDVDRTVLGTRAGVELVDGSVPIGPDTMTAHPGVFAGGDVVVSERAVTSVVGNGKPAARFIDAWLRDTHPSTLQRGRRSRPSTGSMRGTTPMRRRASGRCSNRRDGRRRSTRWSGSSTSTPRCTRRDAASPAATASSATNCFDVRRDGAGSSQLLRRATARVAEIDLVVAAARPVTGGGDPSVQPHDRRGLVGIRADVQDLCAAALVPPLVPESVQGGEVLLGTHLRDGVGNQGGVDRVRLGDHGPPMPPLPVGIGHSGGSLAMPCPAVRAGGLERYGRSPALSRPAPSSGIAVSHASGRERAGDRRSRRFGHDLHGLRSQRIQRDSQAIATSLVRHGHPFDRRPERRRYRLLDALLLDVLDDPAQLERAFARLLSANPADRVLRFLDEDTAWGDELRLVAALPPGPYLRA